MKLYNNLLGWFYVPNYIVFDPKKSMLELKNRDNVRLMPKFYLHDWWNYMFMYHMNEGMIVYAADLNVNFEILLG